MTKNTALINQMITNIRGMILSLRRVPAPKKIDVVSGAPEGFDPIALHQRRLRELYWIQTAPIDQIVAATQLYASRCPTAMQIMEQGNKDLSDVPLAEYEARALYEICRDSLKVA